MKCEYKKIKLEKEKFIKLYLSFKNNLVVHMNSYYLLWH